MSTVLIYALFMIIGMILGIKSIGKKFFSNKIDKLQTLLLSSLIFVMGISLGNDENLISNIVKIGINGIAFGIATIIGAVIFVHLYVKIIRKGIKKDVD